MRDIRAAFIAILVEELTIPQSQIAEITDASSLREDLGVDSLESVELLMSAEEQFGIEIGDDEAEQWATVGDAVTWLEAHVPQTWQPRPIEARDTDRRSHL